MKTKTARNYNLIGARAAKKDEFYTQYEDVAKEMKFYTDYDKDVFRNKVILCPCDDPSQSSFTNYFFKNFNRLGLKKLISTSYAHSSVSQALFGSVFVKTRGGVSVSALNGDGDFRSPEVCSFLKEADFVITNPPFSLFRGFLKWITDAEKKFIIIGNLNSVICKDVFPLFRDNKMWFGASIHSGDRKFFVPDDYPLDAYTCGVDEDGKRFIRVKGVRWFTNVEYANRHIPMKLSTMAENLKSNAKLIRKFKTKFNVSTYPFYDGYDAIEVPYADAIPSDYNKTMGVPISFLDKYCPSQFTIIGLDRYVIPKQYLVGGRATVGGKAGYARILIRKKERSV